MGEIADEMVESEIWESHAQEMATMRDKRRNQFKDLIEDLEDRGYTVREINPYQFRINEELDIYPSNKRYFDLMGKVWGDIRNITFIEFINQFFTQSYAKSL